MAGKNTNKLLVLHCETGEEYWAESHSFIMGMILFNIFINNLCGRR